MVDVFFCIYFNYCIKKENVIDLIKLSFGDFFFIENYNGDDKRRCWLYMFCNIYVWMM